jgi:hypothetical protein
MIVVHIG